MFRRLARTVTRRRTTPAPPPPVVHHDGSATWRGYLPEDGQQATAACGCAGRVSRASRRHGGFVSLLIQVACPGHPLPTGGLEHLVAGAIGHFFASQIQPDTTVQQEMETAA